MNSRSGSSRDGRVRLLDLALQQTRHRSRHRQPSRLLGPFRTHVLTSRWLRSLPRVPLVFRSPFWYTLDGRVGGCAVAARRWRRRARPLAAVSAATITIAVAWRGGVGADAGDQGAERRSRSRARSGRRRRRGRGRAAGWRRRRRRSGSGRPSPCRRRAALRRRATGAKAPLPATSRPSAAAWTSMPAAISGLRPVWSESQPVASWPAPQTTRVGGGDDAIWRTLAPWAAR